MIMTKEKLKGYESPTMDVLEVKVEGLVCNSPNYSLIIGAAGADAGYNDYADF